MNKFTYKILFGIVIFVIFTWLILKFHRHLNEKKEQSKRNKFFEDFRNLETEDIIYFFENGKETNWSFSNNDESIVSKNDEKFELSEYNNMPHYQSSHYYLKNDDEDINKHIEGFQTVVEGFNLFKKIEDVFKPGGEISSAVDPLTKVLNSINDLKNEFSSIKDVFGNFSSVLDNKIVAPIKGEFNKIDSKVTGEFNKMGSEITGGFNKMDSSITGGFNKMGSEITGGFNKMDSSITGGFNKMGSEITGGFNKMGDKMDSWFKPIVQFINVVKNEISNLKERFKRLNSSFVKLGHAFEIFSTNLNRSIELEFKNIGKVLDGGTKCVGHFANNFRRCIIYWVLDVIGEILYSIFIIFPVWFIETVSGHSLSPMINKLYEWINSLDGMIKSVLGISFIHYPESVLDKCYRCSNVNFEEIINKFNRDNTVTIPKYMNEIKTNFEDVGKNFNSVFR